MVALNSGQSGWKREDWIALSWVFGLLMIYPMMNGYPFVYYDSLSYAAGDCVPTFRSPVLGLVMRPIILVAGHWGYVIFQSGVTAFCLVNLSRNVMGNANKPLLISSIILAWTGLFSGWLMADIWTLIGLVVLFGMLTGSNSQYMTALFIFSVVTHYGNFPIFFGTAIVFGVFTMINKRSMIIMVFCILAGIMINATINFGIMGQFKFASPRSFSFVASRILFDIPEILDKKCQDDPEFGLCKLKTEISFKRGTQHSDLLWYFYSEQKVIERLKIESLARELVLFSLTRFPFDHMVAAIKNTFDQLLRFTLHKDFLPLETDSHILDQLNQSIPDARLSYQKTWQARGYLAKAISRFATPLNIIYWLAMMICLASVIVERKKLRDDIQAQLALFALVAVIINAFFVSNLSGVLARFHTRIGFLPMFAALTNLWRWAIILKKLYHAKIAAFNLLNRI